jgi:hypothetical protein
MEYFTVVLDAFDGQQSVLLPLCVQAGTKEQAEAKAIKQAEDDGWQVKVMFTLETT